MVKTILIDVIALVYKSPDGTQIGHVTGGKQQRTGTAGQRGQFFLQGMMLLRMAIDQMGGTTADPIGFNTTAHTVDHSRVTGQPQIIIAAKGHAGFAVHLHNTVLSRLQQVSTAIQVVNLTLIQSRL